MSKLINVALLRRFKQVGKQNIPNPLVLARYYMTGYNWEWYVTEYNGKTFYGWASSNYHELSFFTIPPAAIRDMHWQEKRLSEVPVYAQSGR